MPGPRAHPQRPADPPVVLAEPAPVAISLCGGLRIEVGGERLDDRVPSRQARLLIAYLALNRGRAVTRDELIERLWADRVPSAPRAALSVVLTRARHALGPDVVSDLPQRAVALPERAQVDVSTALETAADARRALEAGDAPAALELAGAGLAILERPLLPGVEADWLDERRRELEERRADALESLGEAGLAVGGPAREAAAGAARALIKLQPYRESGYTLLMRCHAAAGERAEALRTYDRLRVVLREELGMPPGLAARELAERLLRAPERAAPEPHDALPAPLRGERGPLCGRDEELGRLVAWWRAAGGGLTLCGLSGDAGIGKTRLAAELARCAHADGACVLYGRSDAETLPIPYQPVIACVRQLLARAPDLAERPELAAELNELARLVPELRRGPRPLDEPAPDPQLRRHRLFEAVTALLSGAAGDAGLLLVLDDLQWADEPTVALLRHLLRTETPGRLAVLALYRTPELSPDHPVSRALADAWRERPGERVALSGLDTEGVTRLVDAAMPGGATASLLDALVAHTGGNPLFLEEIVRELRESRRLDGDPADLDDLAGVGVPAGVQVVVGRRLERLGDDDAATLADAAAIGLEFELRVLERLDASGDPLAALERAAEAGIVVERTPPGRFAFAHALVRDAVYTRHGHARRARTHARLARLLEAHPDLDATHAERARHWRAAGEPAPELDASLAAAAAAADVGAFDEALRHYERALELWPAVREAGGELALLEQAAEAARWRGRPSRAAELVQRGLELLDAAPAPGGEARHAGLEERLGRYLWEAGDWEGSLRAYDAAVLRLQDRADTVETARALAGRATVLMLRERFADALEPAGRALAVARALGARREEGNALNTYGVALALTGRMREGLQALREALAIAGEVGNLEDQTRAYGNLAELLTRAGETAEAAEIAEAGYRSARRNGLSRSGAPIVAANAVAALARLGRWDEACALADESLKAGMPDGVGGCLRVICARLAVLRGDPDRARAELARAEPVVRDAFEPEMFAEYEEAAIEIALCDGDLARARESVRRGLAALAEAEEEGELTLRLSALGLRVAAAAGDRAWGAALAGDASRIARDMAARGVLFRPAAALALACEAERTRLSGEPSARACDAAVRAFREAGDRYATARAELEQARAWLAEDSAGEARAALERARALADELGAVALQGEIGELALTTAGPPPGS